MWRAGQPVKGSVQGNVCSAQKVDQSTPNHSPYAPSNYHYCCTQYDEIFCWMQLINSRSTSVWVVGRPEKHRRKVQVQKITLGCEYFVTDTWCMSSFLLLTSAVSSLLSICVCREWQLKTQRRGDKSKPTVMRQRRVQTSKQWYVTGNQIQKTESESNDKTAAQQLQQSDKWWNDLGWCMKSAADEGMRCRWRDRQGCSGEAYGSHWIWKARRKLWYLNSTAHVSVMSWPCRCFGQFSSEERITAVPGGIQQ